MGRWMKTATIKPNGTPGQYEVRYGVVEKLIFAVLSGALVTAIAGNVAMYREIGALAAKLDATATAVQGVGDKLDHHLDYSRDIVPKFLTREEYQRDRERGR